MPNLILAHGHVQVQLHTIHWQAWMGKKIKSSKESAVFDIVHTGHNAIFDDFETLVKECDEFRLLFRKSLLILWDDPPYVKSIPQDIFS